MPVPPQDAEKKRYLVRSLRDPQPLTAFIKSAHLDPDMDLLDLIGPAGQPHTAVVALSEDRARQLETQFRNSGDLHIEPDQPLSLF